MDWTKLSKTISHALRHEPWVYELELDEEGWVPVDELLDALRRIDDTWLILDESALQQLVESSSKQRHELRDGRIRAIYGHSLPGKLARRASQPPPVLFHGTSPDAIPLIQVGGLLPMKRQFVHLSPERKTAIEVGKRKAKRPVILQVAATEAAASGVQFYEGNTHVWLADAIPPRFITVCGRVARPERSDGRGD
jgi:putative RNA 2'-phosphotransferase